MALLLPPQPLTDGVVELRPIDGRDLGAIERASLDPEIARRFGLSRLTADEYLASYQKASSQGTAVALAICDVGGDCLGQVMVELRDAGRADLGYWLHSEARGRGRATRAVRLVSSWALRQPGLARVQLWTTPENKPSQRVAERAGFQREGVLRSYGEADGRRVDAVFFSLLPSDLE